VLHPTTASSYLALLPSSYSVTWLENSRLTLCNGGLASWYLPRESLSCVLRDCDDFGDDGHAS
jgi:hypothetical protein